MPNKISQLQNAKTAQKDEFYTQLCDIENELCHYKDFFKGKIVFCNCDDPYESNFFKYFAMHFNGLGLKKLMATCYDGSPIQGEFVFDEKTKENNRKPYKIVIEEVNDENGDGRVDLADVEYLVKNKRNVLALLEGNGDFRSKECVDLLKEADVVVTNPPFSLFRQYVDQLVKYGKKFLIIGNQNAIAYKEIFPLIKDNRMWLGFGFKGGASHFKSCYKDIAAANSHKEGMIRVSGVVWFTNIDHRKLHEPLPLYKRYTPEEYPKYDNYNAIEVRETKLIPEDYDGVMGVPITFLDKYCPEQFEIIGIDRYVADNPHYGKRFTLHGKETYARVLISKIH